MDEKGKMFLASVKGAKSNKAHLPTQGEGKQVDWRKSTKANQAQILSELRAIIASELGECNPELWPKLCAMRQTRTGYKKIEELVIRYVAKEGMPVGSALAFIEQELQHGIVGNANIERDGE